MTMRLFAGLLFAGFVGVVGSPTRAQEPQVVELLKGYRCMMAAASSDGGSLVVRDAPRAASPELGIAEEPVIAVVAARSVRGYTRVLMPDGRPGWILSRRLVPWATSASPGLRCLPARMSDGRLGFSYAHPG